VICGFFVKLVSTSKNKKMMNFNPAGVMDVFTKTTEKLIKGYEKLQKIEEVEVATTPKELVWQNDLVKLYHYKRETPAKSSVPVLVSFAIMNRHDVLDLQPDRSLMKKLLDEGLDIYIMDWGYPKRQHRYLTMEDYILGFMNDAVDFIRKSTKNDKIHKMGICQGGTFSTIYASIYPEKLKSLTVYVAPFDFSGNECMLYQWTKDLELLNFLRMEKWKSDTPDQAGEMFRKYIKDLWQGNKLIKGDFELGGHKVNLKNATMPFLNVFATDDNIIPNSSTTPVMKVIGSKDKQEYAFPGGHIGVFVGARSQKELGPNVAKWIIERS